MGNNHELTELIWPMTPKWSQISRNMQIHTFCLRMILNRYIGIAKAKCNICSLIEFINFIVFFLLQQNRFIVMILNIQGNDENHLTIIIIKEILYFLLYDSYLTAL